MGQEGTKVSAPAAERAGGVRPDSGPDAGPDSGPNPGVPPSDGHVLVIEDEPNISEAIRFILQRDGLQVTVLGSGDTALNTIADLHPSLIILDVMLPGVSGFEILQQMRARPVLATIPVILLTANGQTAAREKAAQYGASRFMAKPFSNSDLLGAVRDLMRT